MIKTRFLYGVAIGAVTALAPMGISTNVAAQTVEAGATAVPTTGDVIADGYGVVGVQRLVWDGDNFTNGGSTTVTGVFSRGVYTLAMNGNNVTNSGTVSATGDFARAVMSITFAGESCGTNTVNVTGDVTATFHGLVLFGCGTTEVNVLAGNTVRNIGVEGIPIIQIATAATTNISGSVIARSSDSIAIDPRSDSSLTLIQNNGYVLGTFDGTDGVDVFGINGGGTWTTSGTSDFLAGADALTNAGTLNLAGPTSFVGLEAFNQAGRLNLNSASLTLFGTAFINAGTIDTSGNASILGITAFSNAGSLDLAPGTFTVPAVPFANSGTIFADEGSSAISGQTDFANSGTIDLQDGVSNDVLTIDSNFVGSGGSKLLIDAIGASADRLVISGAASGTTVVNVDNGGVFRFNQTGILVVDNGTSTANSFVLGANPGNGLFYYRLEQRGADFFLVTDPTALAFAPVAIGNLAQDMWYQGTDAYLSYAALKRGDKADRRSPVGLWAQLYASSDRYGDHETATIGGSAFDFDNRLKTHRRGAQTGVDFGIAGATFGVTAGYQHANSNRDVTAFDAEGYNLGAYGLFGGETGIYGGLLVKRDWNKVQIKNLALNNRHPDARATGVDGEVGYRFGSTAMSFDVQAGLSYVRTKVDDIAAGGLSYNYDQITSTRGRIGARVGFGNMFGAYVDAKLLREFSGDTDLRVRDASSEFDIGARGRGTWGRLEVGVGGDKTPGPQLAGWAEFGDVKGIGVRGGLRF